MFKHVAHPLGLRQAKGNWRGLSLCCCYHWVITLGSWVHPVKGKRCTQSEEKPEYPPCRAHLRKGWRLVTASTLVQLRAPCEGPGRRLPSGLGAQGLARGPLRLDTQDLGLSLGLLWAPSRMVHRPWPENNSVSIRVCLVPGV